MTRPGERGKLLVLAGPTAVGKGTVVKYIVDHYPNIEVSISATTRSARPGEIDGESYYFVSEEKFDELIASDSLLEYATVHQRFRYGTPKEPVLESMMAGKNVILEIDIQGAFQVQTSFPEAIMVFLLPPSWDELVRRLETRGTESEAERERRLETARYEMSLVNRFEHQVVNRIVAESAQEIVELFRVN